MDDYASSFSDQLEKHAETIVDAHLPDKSSPDVTDVLVNEIALTLEQINRIRQLAERSQHSLLNLECYIDTELMQMEARTPRYSPYRFPEREKLHRRLQSVSEERRSMEVSHEQRLQRLHSQLVQLVSRFDQLKDGR